MVKSRSKRIHRKNSKRKTYKRKRTYKKKRLSKKRYLYSGGYLRGGSSLMPRHQATEPEPEPQSEGRVDKLKSDIKVTDIQECGIMGGWQISKENIAKKIKELEDKDLSIEDFFNLDIFRRGLCGFEGCVFYVDENHIQKEVFSNMTDDLNNIQLIVDEQIQHAKYKLAPLNEELDIQDECNIIKSNNLSDKRCLKNTDCEWTPSCFYCDSESNLELCETLGIYVCADCIDRNTKYKVEKRKWERNKFPHPKYILSPCISYELKEEGECIHSESHPKNCVTRPLTFEKMVEYYNKPGSSPKLMKLIKIVNMKNITINGITLDQLFKYFYKSGKSVDDIYEYVLHWCYVWNKIYAPIRMQMFNERGIEPWGFHDDHPGNIMIEIPHDKQDLFIELLRGNELFTLYQLNEILGNEPETNLLRFVDWGKISCSAFLPEEDPIDSTKSRYRLNNL